MLQTCYRVELYARLTSGVDDARDELVDALSYAHDVSRELLLDHLYVHSGEDVARHLSRVAAGLDSLVLGRGRDPRPGRRGVRVRRGGGNGRAGTEAAVPHRDLGRPSRPLGDRDRCESGDGELDGARARRERARRASRQARARRRRRTDRVADAEGRRRPRDRERRGREPHEGARRSRSPSASTATAHGLDELEDALAVADVAITRDVVGDAGRRGRRRARCDGAARGAAARPRRPRRPGRRRARRGRGRRARGSSTSTICAPGSTTRWRHGCARFRRSRPSSRRRSRSFGRRYRELEVEPLLSELRKQAESIRARELERALDDLGERRSGGRRAHGAPLAHAREAAPARPDRASARARRRRERGRGRRRGARPVRHLRLRAIGERSAATGGGRPRHRASALARAQTESVIALLDGRPARISRARRR